MFTCKHKHRGPVMTIGRHHVHPLTGDVTVTKDRQAREVCTSCGKEFLVTLFSDPIPIERGEQEDGVFRDARGLL